MKIVCVGGGPAGLFLSLLLKQRHPAYDVEVRERSAEGDVQGKRPGFTDMIGRAKYDAWAKTKGMSQDEAMKKYIDLVKSLGG